MCKCFVNNYIRVSLVIIIIWFSFFTKGVCQIFHNPFSGNNEKGRLSELSINVQINGQVAVTTLDMQFYNPNYGWREGELYFSLLPGQSIVSFLLDVNGSMRENSVVEKEKGRVAYEEIVSRRVDPGLLEMIADNNYRLRVYPIFGNQKKRAVLKYEEALGKDSTGFIYQLPLVYNEVMDNISITLSINDHYKEPILTQVPFGISKYENRPGKNQILLDTTNFQPDKGLVVHIPVKNIDKPSVLIEKGLTTKENLFHISVSPVISKPNKPFPRKVAFYVDNSSSMKPENKLLMDFLSMYIKQIGDLSVDFYTFNTKLDFIGQFIIGNGVADKLLDALSGVVYDGTAQLELIDWKNTEYDEVWLCSDGCFLFNNRVDKYGSIPILAINYGAYPNVHILNHMAKVTTGNYLDLTQLNMVEQKEEVLNYPLRLLSTEYNKKEIADLCISNKDVKSYTTFNITGKLKSRKATIVLRFGVKNVVLRQDTIILDATEKVDCDNWVERRWVNQQINLLETNPFSNSQKIKALGMKSQLVTLETSFIVLETIEDYVKYKISPPLEMLNEYQQMITELGQDALQIEEDNLYKVSKDFKRRKKAWKASVDPVKYSKYEEKEYRFEEWKEEWEEWKKSLKDRWIDWENEQAEWERRIWEIENNYRYTQRKNSRAEYYGYSSSIARQKGIMINAGVSNKIRGIVTLASDNQPLVGTAIYVKGTTTGTMADLDGKYEILVPSGSHTLVYSFIGCSPLEVKVQNEVIDVEMGEEYMLLESVVVSGYSSERSYSEIPPSPVRERISQKEFSSIEINEYHDTINQQILSKQLSNISDKDIYAFYLDLKQNYIDIPMFYIYMANLLNDRGLKQEAFTVATNLYEMSKGNPALIAPAAKVMSEIGYHDSAIHLLQLATSMFSDQPFIYRELGMAYAAAGRYQEAVNLLYKISQQIWHEQYRDIQVVVLTDMNRIIAKAKQENVKIKLRGINRKFIYSIPSDIRVVLGWYADNTQLVLRVEKLNENSRFQNVKGIYSERSNGFGPTDFIIQKETAGKYRAESFQNTYRSNTKGKAILSFFEIYTNYGTSNEKRKVFFFESNNNMRQKNYIEFNLFPKIGLNPHPAN